MNNRVGSTINRIYIYSVRFERCDLYPMIYLVYYHNIMFFPLSQTYGNLLISDFFHRPVRSGRIIIYLFSNNDFFLLSSCCIPLIISRSGFLLEFGVDQRRRIRERFQLFQMTVTDEVPDFSFLFLIYMTGIFLEKYHVLKLFSRVSQ